MPPRLTVSLNSLAHAEGLLRRLGKAAREFLYGMTTYEMVLYARGVRGRLEALFFLMTMGDFLGLPVLPPYYSLRLLPYIIPRMDAWKRLVLRERDITDAMSGG